MELGRDALTTRIPSPFFSDGVADKQPAKIESENSSNLSTGEI
jgi:hypothetical protein